DRWIEMVETKIDLSTWAKGRTGLSFGFPHLVRLRWQEIVTAFEQAASKTSTTREFSERYRETIAREAEFAKASAAPVGGWELLRDLLVFVDACNEGERKVVDVATAAALVRLYVERAGVIEKRHIDIRQR